MTRPAHRQGVHRKARAEQRAVDAYSRWMEGATYAEIGRELDCDRKVARDRVLRGIALLRGEVEDKRDRIGHEHLNDMVALEPVSYTHLTLPTKA